MTPEENARLEQLQSIPWRARTEAETAELSLLRTELAREQQETADDPRTLFVDESRRPLLDGTDYNDTLKAMCWNEVETALRKGLEVLGEAAVKAIVARTLP